jgi:hypothetical protein
MLLTQIQRRLANLYEAHTEYDIYDFLITDQRLANAMTPAREVSANDERILIYESHGDLEMSVYVNEQTLNYLHKHDPIEELHEGNINEFLLAVEGVSHFNYLCWNAGHDKPVTLLELELQAEVDKYVTAVDILAHQGVDVPLASFHGRLFGAVRFNDELDNESLCRYRNANHYAGKYCQALRSAYPGQHAEPKFVNELRRFYRLPQNAKINRIEAGVR